MVLKVTRWGILLLAVGLGSVYVANTLLYLTPPNPVKAQWLPLITRLAHPLFAQNWHLFAPDPIRTNYVLSVRCRTDEGVSAWHDATQPMLSRHHRARTSSMSRLLRVQQNAVRFVLGVNRDEWRALVCRRSPQSPACRREQPEVERQREAGAYVVRRVASAVCDRAVGSGRAREVQAGILLHSPPPWSRRHLPATEGSTRFLPLPWESYLSTR